MEGPGVHDVGAFRFRFAVLADTHMNPRDGESPSPWLTNRQANARTRAVVHEINRLRPEFTVHLGDIVHPVPSQDTYAEAAGRAHDILGRLEAPLYLVAGNHDMGDKPVDWAPATVVNDEFLAVYAHHFGRDHYSFDHEDCHFIVLNSQVLNSGLDREAEQWRWLEDDLRRSKGRRIFLFTHYPPYVAHRDEYEHYDNMGEPARGRLLDLLASHRTTAVFAGHVHNFFYDRPAGFDLYVLPAVSAVRHDYSELFRSPPQDADHGRDDNAKLGFFVVDVYEKDHVAHFVRSHGAIAEEDDAGPSRMLRLPKVHSRIQAVSPVGVDMRHSWAKTVDIPYQGVVDEFYRKKARNDYALAALWEMGVRKLRIPLDDLLDREARERVATLRELGHEFLLFTYDVPKGEVADLVHRDRRLLAGLEVILPWRRMGEAMSELAGFKRRTGLPIHVSKLRSSAEAKAVGARYTHFISHGFGDGEGGQVTELLHLPERDIDGVVIRVEPQASVVDRVSATVGLAEGARVIAHVTLADENPAVAAEDELATANRVAAALLTGHVYASRCEIYLDTLADMDRGYFPRFGLVDRRFNPRLAGSVLGTLQGELASAGRLESLTERALPDGGTLLASTGDGRRLLLFLPAGPSRLTDVVLPNEALAIDLATGTHVAGEWRPVSGGVVLDTPGDVRAPVLIVGGHVPAVG